MNVGIDVGYSAVKAVSGDRRAIFLSAVGTPDKARFSLNGDDALILEEPAHVQVGAGAVEQSRFIKRREDRKWTQGDEWYTLFLAALSELSTTRYDSAVRVVTGLPVAFYDDRAAVKARLIGEHKLRREDRHAQTFVVVDAKIVPQPLGTLCAMCMNDKGKVVDMELATGAVGVIDCGGKTCNLLSVNRLREIGRETASVNIGAWDAVRAIRRWLDDNCPDLELRDHQVIDAIIARETLYYGERVDLGDAVDAALEPLADQVIAEASQLWNGAAALAAILVSGGGAYLLGPYIERHFRHARVVPDPVWANAVGFWRFGQWVASQ